MLVDADKDVDLFPVEEGQVLDLGTLPAALTLRADTIPAAVGSVEFKLGETSARMENAGPYCFAGEHTSRDILGYDAVILESLH